MVSPEEKVSRSTNRQPVTWRQHSRSKRITPPSPVDEDETTLHLALHTSYRYFRVLSTVLASAFNVQHPQQRNEVAVICQINSNNYLRKKMASKNKPPPEGGGKERGELGGQKCSSSKKQKTGDDNSRHRCEQSLNRYTITHSRISVSLCH